MILKVSPPTGETRWSELQPRKMQSDPGARATSTMSSGRSTKAAQTYEEVVRTNPAFISGRRGLAAAYAYLGRIEDAEWEGAEILVLQPDFSLGQERVSNAFKRQEDMERYIEGLR